MTEYNQHNGIAYHEFRNGEFVICSSDKDDNVLFYYCSENNILTLNVCSVDENGGVINEKKELRHEVSTKRFYDKKNRILYVNNRKEKYYLDAFYRPIKFVAFTGFEEIREYDEWDNIIHLKVNDSKWVKRKFEKDGNVIMYEDSNGNWWDKELMPEVAENPFLNVIKIW